jgi:hypothetical protein
VTAKHYMWSKIIQHLLLPRIRFLGPGESIVVAELPRRAPPSHSRPYLPEGESIAPQLVGWMADHLERRHTSREDRARALTAFVKG